MMEMVVTTGPTRHVTLQSNSHRQQTNTQLNISQQIHLVGKRFRLKIHQNNQFLLFC